MDDERRPSHCIASMPEVSLDNSEGPSVLLESCCHRTWDLEGEGHTDVVLDAGSIICKQKHIWNSIKFKRLCAIKFKLVTEE